MSASDGDAVKYTVTAAMTYQLFGLGEQVLHIGEAETGHSDELTHHRHKFVAQLLRSLLLVLQLLYDPGEEHRGGKNESAIVFLH